MSIGDSIGRNATRDEIRGSAAFYDRELLKRLWVYLRPYRFMAGVSLMLLMLTSAMGACWPILTQIAVDRYLKPDASRGSFLDPYLPQDGTEGLLMIGALYVGLLAVSSIIRSAQIHTMNRTGQCVMRDIRREVFGHLQRLPVGYYDRTPSGRIVTRVTTDVDVLNELFTSGLVAVAGDVLTLVFFFGAMLWLSPPLTLAYLAVAPLVLLVSVVFRREARASFREVRGAVARLASFLQECFSGIEAVQLFRHERGAAREFDVINEEHRQANYRAVRAHSLFFPIIDWLNYLGLALLVVFGGAWVVDGSVTLGVLLAFLQYGTRVFRPVQDLAEKYNVLQAAMAGAERIFELLDTQPQAEELEGRDDDAGPPSIEFRNVWFAYLGEDWVLRDVSFTVAPAEMVAVVGHTGAGKSTLLNLLLRYYEIQRGSILVGGRDIRDWDRSALRSQFSVALQEPCLLARSVAENIGFDDRDVSIQRIHEAAEAARLAHHVKALEKGYDEPIHDSGGRLSSGQKQLVAFARALARDRPYLILDEATSSVDPETEQDIRNALRDLLHRRTSIVIAHRLSSIRQAKRILVFHRGRVVESGDHDELIALGGIFSRLHQLQSLKEPSEVH